MAEAMLEQFYYQMDDSQIENSQIEASQAEEKTYTPKAPKRKSARKPYLKKGDGLDVIDTTYCVPKKDTEEIQLDILGCKVAKPRYFDKTKQLYITIFDNRATKKTHVTLTLNELQTLVDHMPTFKTIYNTHCC